MNFPVIIRKSETEQFAALVPDIPGCSSAGQSLEDALRQAREAIHARIEELMAAGEAIPRPSEIEEHKEGSEYENGVWALVTVDLSRIYGKSKRINITVPERILVQVDSFVRKYGDSRSGFLVQAALEFMSNHPNGQGMESGDA